MKKIFIIIALCIVLCGCSNEDKVDKKQLNMSEIKDIMINTEYFIIDVRTKEEYDSGHLVDSINIPYNQISNIEYDKNKVIFVYCKSGNRSNIAYETLISLGYTVYDLGAYSNIDLPKE